MACSGSVFHDWLVEQKVSRSADLAELRGAQVAIDGDDYVDRLLTDLSSREPLLPALGGLPMGMKKHVNSHLEVFKEYNITPRFVFNGLALASRDRTAVSREAKRTSDSLTEAWSLYSQSRADAAVEEFGKSCTYRSEGVRRWLVQYLVKRGIHSMLATYSAAAQMVYWKTKLGKNADALAGSLDLILFGAEKIITQFDWDAKTFSWTTTELIRNKLALSQEQLIDLSLFSGLTILPALDEVADSTQPPLETARIVLGRVNFDGLVASTMSKNEKYQMLYKKARIVVKHIPVLKTGGKLEPLNYTETPGDLHECISQRLPDEVLFYSARGFVDPKLLNARAQQEYFDTAPLDGGSSQAYRDLIQIKLKPLRRQALAVLSHRLHRYYQRADVSLVPWFNESSAVSLELTEAITTLSKAAEQWQVPDTVLKTFAQYDKATFEATPISTTLSVLSDNSNAAKTITTDPTLALSTSTEFLSNSTWRFLQGQGYIDNTHKLTAWGSAYNKAFQHAKSNGYAASASSVNEAEEAIFMAFELIRLDLLDGSPMFTAQSYTGAPMRGTDIDKANTNLISRVACLATFQHRELGFTGPLSRHLLAFQQVASGVRIALRHLLEVYAVDMLLAGTFTRDITPKQWSGYGAQLPLLKEPDLGLALVVKSYLDELSNDPARRSDITKWFPQAINVHADLQMAWKLWDAVNVGIQAAEGVTTQIKTTFSKADEWLRVKLAAASVPLTNGTA